MKKGWNGDWTEGESERARERSLRQRMISPDFFLGYQNNLKGSVCPDLVAGRDIPGNGFGSSKLLEQWPTTQTKQQTLKRRMKKQRKEKKRMNEETGLQFQDGLWKVYADVLIYLNKNLLWCWIKSQRVATVTSIHGHQGVNASDQLCPTGGFETHNRLVLRRVTTATQFPKYQRALQLWPRVRLGVWIFMSFIGKTGWLSTWRSMNSSALERILRNSGKPR